MSFETLDGISFAAAAWLATYLMHSTLWLASAWLLTRAVRSSGLAEWVWRAALVGGLVTATLHGRIGGFEPAAGVHVARPGLAGPVIAVAPPAERVESRAMPAATVVTPPDAADAPGPFGQLSAPPAAAPIRWYQVVSGLWVLGAALALAHLVHLKRRLRRLLAHRRPVEEGPLVRALERVRSAAGSTRDVRLTSTPHLASPVALAGDEICVPDRAAIELGPQELETMLAHELAHLERRDPAWSRALAFLQRVLFPQPLNQLAARRLDEAAEYLCDERAVAWTGGNVALARCLHEVATWRGAGAPFVSAMVRPTSPLVDRVRRVLEGTGSAPTRTQRGAVASWAVTGLVLLACQGPGISAESTPGDEPAQSTELVLLIPLPPGAAPDWDELEREVDILVEANRVANGGVFSPEDFERHWNSNWRASEPTGARVTMRAVVRLSEAGLEWVEREVGTITYGMMVSDGSGEPRMFDAESLPVGDPVSLKSWPPDLWEEPATTLEVLPDGSVKVMLVLPMEGQPGATMATGSQVTAGDDFPERFHKMLAYAASQMPRQPVDPEQPDGPSLPSSLVVLKVDESASFGTVQEILKACAAEDVGLWNLAFEIEGPDGPLRVKTPLPLDAAAKADEAATRVRLDVEVQQAGSKVHPESGEPWGGKGPFRFKGRAVTYSTTVQTKAKGSSLGMGGYASDPEEALWMLEQMRKKLPDMVLTLDARPGVVYGDLAELVARVRGAEIPLRFAGRAEGAEAGK